MSDRITDDDVQVIALADLEDDADDEFYPCEETTDVVGVARDKAPANKRLDAEDGEEFL